MNKADISGFEAHWLHRDKRLALREKEAPRPQKYPERNKGFRNERRLARSLKAAM